MLILFLALRGVAFASLYLQMYAPSNAIVAKVRRERPRLRIAAGLAGLSATLAAGAFLLSDRMATGGPGWLHLIVLIAIWDSFKMGFLALAVVVRRALLALQHAAGQPARVVAS
jgi:hypothetical protein